METAGLVSVVVPAFNAELFVELAIRSVVAQTFSEIEIVVVDDGSTDRTAELVTGMMRTDPRIRLIRTSNRGVANARNRGIKESRGDLVAFIDADDLWHPDKLGRQVEALSASGDAVAAVYVHQRFIDEKGLIVGDARPTSSTGIVFARHIVMQLVGNGSSLLVRRHAAIEVGGFDPSISGCEDFDFELRLAQRYRFDVVPAYLVGYRKHGASLSSNRAAMMEGLRQTIRRNAGRCPELPDGVQRWAEAAVARYETRTRLSEGRAIAAASAYAKSLRLDPAYGACLLAAAAMRGAARVVRRTTGCKTSALRGTPFLDAPPEVSDREFSFCEVRRLNQLESVDRTMAASTPSGRDRT